MASLGMEQPFGGTAGGGPGFGAEQRSAEAQAAARAEAEAVRARIRAGEITGPTAGLAPLCFQGNLVILPADWAADFDEYCRANPAPCPVIGKSEPGSPHIPALGASLDLRTDVPRYKVFEHGEVVDEPTDIRGLWQDDFVAFVLGCSFTFEAALMAEGIPVRHIEMGSNTPMYRTSRETVPAGPFRGPLVVSMRPMTPAQAERAREITLGYEAAHGPPVHIGDPAEIGIADIGRTDFGDAVPVREGEVPVFWACGVTPQAALEQARPPLAITHSPGAMVITDIPA